MKFSSRFAGEKDEISIDFSDTHFLICIFLLASVPFLRVPVGSVDQW